MKVFHNSKALRAEVDSSRSPEKCIGLVPTMGALHKGHLSLMEMAHDDGCVVVVSIYVNPTQFNNAQDLIKYPRALDTDLELIESLGFEVLVYAPDNNDLYGDAVTSMSFNFGKLEQQMEGRYRKGHFDGVGTVLSLLFKAIEPDKAYFGEKDFQQLQIVRKLNEMKSFGIDIVGCPIIRESNGVAMSSRNRRLTPDQLTEAAMIFETLTEVANRFSSESISKLTKWVEKRFSRNKILDLEYFVIANERTLEEAKRKRSGNKYRAFIAVHCGKVRLIDNMPLN